MTDLEKKAEEILKQYPCNRVLKGGKQFWGKHTLLKIMTEFAQWFASQKKVVDKNQELESKQNEIIKATKEFALHHGYLFDRTTRDMILNALREQAIFIASQNGWIDVKEVEIDFGGQCKAKLQLKNNEVKVLAAMDGYGNAISLNNIEILPQPPKL